MPKRQNTKISEHYCVRELCAISAKLSPYRWGMGGEAVGGGGLSHLPCAPPATRHPPPLLASSSPVPPQPSCQLSCNYSPLLALCKQLTATADGSLLPLTARICVSFGTICTLECYSSWVYLCKRIDPVGKSFRVFRARNSALEYQIGKFDQNREGPS